MLKTVTKGYYATLSPKKSKELSLLHVAKCDDPENPETARRAADQLIKLNEGFLKDFIGKRVGKISPADFDDLIQEGRVAFNNAIKSYDLSQGTSIRSYARYHLLGAIREWQKSEELYKKIKAGQKAEINAPYITRQKKILLGEQPVLKDPDTAPSDLTNILEKGILEALTQTEAEVVTLHYFGQMKKRAIAIQRGCSEARICTIIKQALPKLKAYLLSCGRTVDASILN